jgi:hypothetical protein
MLAIATGIQGIKKILSDNKSGWHVHNITTDSYLGFYTGTLSEIRKELFSEYSNYRITFFGGNVLSIEIK